MGDNYWAQYHGPIKKIATPAPAQLQNKNWKNVLGLAGSGGTYFSSALTNDLIELVKMDYSIITFTDKDILTPTNFVNFRKLYDTNPKSVFLVLDKSAVYKRACQDMGSVPPTFTYMKE